MRLRGAQHYFPPQHQLAQPPSYHNVTALTIDVRHKSHDWMPPTRRDSAWVMVGASHTGSLFLPISFEAAHLDRWVPLQGGIEGR